MALTLVTPPRRSPCWATRTESLRNVRWMERNLDFDIDVRVNAFECNIRVLAGLLSAHVIALATGEGGEGTARKRPSWFGKGMGSGPSARLFDVDGGMGHSVGSGFMPDYEGGLLPKALDLGERLLKAF